MSAYSYNILGIPEILLPKPDISMEKWATIACDQFTSNQKYWEQVETEVGDQPSTLKITFPEFYLGKIDETAKINAIQDEMRQYLAQELFTNHQGMILVERQIDNGIRHGLLATIDLEAYDYTKGSSSWIRASEGTVDERIPPRMRIREGAPLEVPHILLLIDDPQKKLIEPLSALKSSLPVLYNFDLMMKSGHVRGYSLAIPEIENRIMTAIREMQSDEALNEKYDLPGEQNRILFAVGDGNHSLATAKAIWEKHKAVLGPNHPARYALVEIENLHDPILRFEPIHRVIFERECPALEQLQAVFGDEIEILPTGTEALFAEVDATPDGSQAFGVLENDQAFLVRFIKPPSALCVGSVQHFLDNWQSTGGFREIDYIHGTADLLASVSGDHNSGFYLPPVQKTGFFQGIINDGALPRKTFSMGEAHEKRFYIECRRIL